MNKLLKITGLCSTGGEANIVITEGLVAYNDQVDTRKRLKVRKGDTVTYNDQKIEVE